MKQNKREKEDICNTRINVGNSVIPSNVTTFVQYEPQKQERKRCAKYLFQEIIAENFPSLGKKTNIQIQEAQEPQQSRPTPKHPVIKFAKYSDKEKKSKQQQDKRSP